jgi:hypothetical protein
VAEAEQTREDLRMCQGLIAGGKCYGYTNVRQTHAIGREVTIDVINEVEATIVQAIFRLYVKEDLGLKRIADTHNRRGVPSPRAGLRGTGSWSNTAVPEILQRERYRGIYVHGKIDRVCRNGKRLAEGFTFSPEDLPTNPAAPRRRVRPRKRVWAVSATAHPWRIISPSRVPPPILG